MLCTGKSKKVKKATKSLGTNCVLTADLIEKISEGDEAGVQDLIQVGVTYTVMLNNWNDSFHFTVNINSNSKSFLQIPIPIAFTHIFLFPIPFSL